MSHMPFLQYARYVGNSGFNLNMLITRLTFDTDSDVPKLFFSNVEFLDTDTHSIVIGQGQTAAAINAGKMSFKKKGETAATTEMPKLVAPAGSAAAKIKAEEAAAKPAPKAKPAPAPAPVAAIKDSGLSTLVDEWGDD
jgi:cell division septation protein DedD